MYIADQPGVTDADVHRYFGECVLFDPLSQMGGVVLEVTKRRVELLLADGTRRSYRNADANIFLDTKTYHVGDLGWRNVNLEEEGPTAMYFSRIVASGGCRGLGLSRIKRITCQDILYSTPVPFASIEMPQRPDRSMETQDIAGAVFSQPSEITLEQAIDATSLRGRSSIALNSNVSLMRVVSYANRIDGVLFLGGHVVGAVNSGNKTVITRNKALGDFVGGLDAFAVRTK